MAVRFDNATDYLRRTASLPTTTAFTVCGWAKRSVDRNSYSSVFALDDGGPGSSYILFTTDSNGDTLKVWSPSGDATVATLSDGVWFFWAVVGSGTGAGGLTAYYATGTAALGSASVVGASFSAAALTIGTDSYAEPFNGLAASVKIYDAVLTVAELEMERLCYVPVRTANLHLWWPLISHSDTTDYSGNGKSATVGGTLATEDGPPIAWRCGPAKLFIPTGGGTDVTVSSSVLSAAFGTNAISYVLDQVLSIAAQSAAFSIPSISFSLEHVLAQSAQNLAFTLNAPTVAIDVTTPAGVNVGTFNTNTISYLTDQILSIGAQSNSFTIPTVTVLAGGDVLIDLTSPVTVAAALNTPGVVTDAILDIGTNTLTFVLNPATVQISTPTTGVVSRMYIVLGLR